MKKTTTVCIVLSLVLLTVGCTSQQNDTEIPAAVGTESIGNDVQPPADGVSGNVEEQEAAVVPVNENDTITDEMALAAIENYCCTKEPGLKEDADAGKYYVYWEISSSDENEIVVLYRSYTSALVRYYIDRTSGDTYVTEFVPGITPEEERTDESFNIRDYIPDKAD